MLNHRSGPFQLAGGVMKTFFIFPSLILILFTSAATANAGEAREIELIDGSIITGEVLSLVGGICTIKSDSLGTIKLDDSKIRAIRAKSAGLGAHKDAVSVSGEEVRSL